MGVELRGIRKHFGPVRANDGVDLTVASGTLHGLLGENGAGKSTLMKILSGYQQADGGEILVDGRPVTIATPQDAIAHGIGMLHQDPLVFLPMSVLDNFLLAAGGRLNRSAARRELNDLAGQFGFSFDPEAPVRTLTVGERQQLEIVRLLWLGVKLLILDEPTTGISATQREKLFATLRELAGHGMSVVFVSHKLEEVEELCERVTVMRAGKTVGDRELPCPVAELVTLMFGQPIEIGARSDVPLGEPALECVDLTLRDRLLEMSGISLEVAAGEVLGLAGLEGSGQQVLLRACAGLDAPLSGVLRIGGRSLGGKSYRHFLDAGVRYLPAGRLEEGLVRGLTITEHFFLAGDDQPFFVDWDEAESQAASSIEHYSIKGVPGSMAEALSGGNQQRLLLAMLRPQLELLLMEHPTRGLDIASANWVWEQLLARRDDGTAIAFASADLDELLQYSDRIAVFFSGQILEIIDRSTATVDDLGLLIGGRRR